MAILENAFGQKCVIQNLSSTLERPDMGYLSNAPVPESTCTTISLSWKGCCWVIENQSRYSIWLADRALLAGAESPLETGIDIYLARQWYCKWTVIDLSSPDKTNVFLAGNGYWYSQAKNKNILLKDGDIIYAAERKWCLCCFQQSFMEQPNNLPLSTAGGQMCLVFEVSQDEEHVVLSMELDGQVINLNERVHHYLLVTLARLKLEDHRNGHDASSCGWVCMEELCRMMGTDASHINIQIYRVRKQVSESFFSHLELPPIIERRSGSLRLGAWGFKIIHGSNVEGNMQLS